MIQLVYGVLPYLTSVSHHAFPVASLINRQHVMIPRCSNMADPKRPIKLHRKQNNSHAVKVLVKPGMSEYSWTCYKILTDIQIAFKLQSNSLKCPQCVWYKDTELWYKLWYKVDMTFCCNPKQAEIELDIYLHMEKINHWIFLLYFSFYYSYPFITYSLCSFRFLCKFFADYMIFSLIKQNKLLSKNLVHCVL